MMYQAKRTVSSERHTKHKWNVISMQSFRMLNQVVRTVTGRLYKDKDSCSKWQE